MSEKRVPIKLESLDLTKIYITVLVIVLTIVLFALYKRRKSSRNGILFTGLCDSGKTLIYSQLVAQKNIQTHTSIKENVSNFTINNDVLKLIDVPGHERLRDKFFEQYKTVAKGIVYVVDSLTIQKDIRDAAEYLYNVLTDSTITNNTPRMLILCNKQDQTLAKGSNVIKSIFEKELNTLRITKSSQLQSVDPKANQRHLLGDAKKDFSFASLPLKVDFAECFANSKDESSDISQLHSWLSSF